MPLIRKNNNDFELYQCLDEGCLVAIPRIGHEEIKKHKKSGIKVAQKVKGFKFVMDEEMGSLRIDFSVELDFFINNLTKAKME